MLHATVLAKTFRVLPPLLAVSLGRRQDLLGCSGEWYVYHLYD